MTQVDPVRVSYDDEMSLLKVASVGLRRRRLILLATLGGGLLGLLFAFTSPLQYTASASFLPHGGDEAVLAGVSGLAQQFGFLIPSTGEAERSPEFYQDLLRSREILSGLVRPGVEVATADGVTKVDLAEYFEVKGETPEERNARTREYLAEDVISVSMALGTSVVTLSVRTDDPELSAAIGRRLLELISVFDLETRQSQASAERGFAEERLAQLRVELSIAEDSLLSFLVENRQFVSSPQLTFEHDRLQRQVVMRQELVTAMAQAFEQARIEEVRNTSLLTLIDQPEVPPIPDTRGVLVKLVLGLTMGFLAGFGLAFVRDFDERAKDEGSEAYGEFQQVLEDARRDLFGLRRSRRPAQSSADADA